MATVQEIEIRDTAARTAAAMDELQDVQGEKMVLNMGPSHPATHGVYQLRRPGPARPVADGYVFGRAAAAAGGGAAGL